MKTIIQFTFLLLLFSCSSTNTSKIEETSKKAFLSNETIVYKETTSNHKLTSLDIYTVKESKALKPVVIWVHGGGWAIGDKFNGMQQKVPFFNNLGYVFVSINYRLSSLQRNKTNETRIQHPIHVNDATDALYWIYKNIHKYGGDTSNIVLIGHSAGAHLVALLGTNQKLLKERNIPIKKLKGIISLDTQAYNVPKAIQNLKGKRLYVNAFSNNVDSQIDASPYFQLDNYKNTVSNWLFASRGNSIRKEILNDFVNKINTKNGKTEVVTMNSYSHRDVNLLISDTSNTILSDKITQFLKSVFYK
ncbi:alpha/beta hydrolase [Polaribacter septentrionalilitoris]|uniref:alpha/beta hydrolase n=1 Tax=Polaribacter septentrionalilitoris TaxID=2494657 RepID=UPI00135C12A7|nr:alpha/beta hydrolase [Polaribacter septentrionalilitoris]